MKHVAVAMSMVWLVGCAGMATTGGTASSGAGGACEGDAACAISSAEAVVKKANSLGAAWRDSDAKIKDAKEALKGGDEKKATKLAREAETEGKLAYEQGLSQKNAGPWQW